MRRFKQFLEEALEKTNFTHQIIGPNDHEARELYATELHGLLQSSYESIGGIHGSGFRSVDDMKKNIPTWYIVKNQKGVIVAGKCYKHKSGFKSVAMGTDGTEEGKAAAGEAVKHAGETRGYWGEASDRALSFAKKHISNLKDIAIHPDTVKKLLPKDEFRKPPTDDPELVRHPELKEHFYQRKISNEWHTKLAYGTPVVTNK